MQHENRNHSLSRYTTFTDFMKTRSGWRVCYTCSYCWWNQRLPPRSTAQAPPLLVKVFHGFEPHVVSICAPLGRYNRNVHFVLEHQNHLWHRWPHWRSCIRAQESYFHHHLYLLSVGTGIQSRINEFINVLALVQVARLQCQRMYRFEKNCHTYFNQRKCPISWRKQSLEK